MSNLAERNQFRRYVGDFPDASVTDETIEAYFDDATYEVTTDFVDSTNAPAPVNDFDVLVVEYHPEVVVKAAINFLWNKAAKFAERHSTSIGGAAQNVSETFDRLMSMIERLETKYAEISYLGTDISMGNLSRFSKGSLRRVGGVREETPLE